MSRTFTTLLLCAWVAATLMLSACSTEQTAAVRPPDYPATGQPETGEPAKDPADIGDESAVPPEVADDPFAAPDDMSNEVPGAEGNSPGPFDVPDELFSDMDLVPGDSDREPKRRPDVHFVPTPQEVVDRMLELANVTKDDLVYDLGCGDGRIVVTAAKRYGAKAIGVDIDPQRVEESRKNVKENEVEDLVEIKEADIFELDLTPASVITLYLLPDLNVRLIPQLEKLKPGTRIVSHAFDMRGVKPDKVETVDAERGTSHTVYLWTTPLQKEDSADIDDMF